MGKVGRRGEEESSCRAGRREKEKEGGEGAGEGGW